MGFPPSMVGRNRMGRQPRRPIRPRRLAFPVRPPHRLSATLWSGPPRSSLTNHFDTSDSVGGYRHKERRDRLLDILCVLRPASIVVVGHRLIPACR